MGRGFGVFLALILGILMMLILYFVGVYLFKS